MTPAAAPTLSNSQTNPPARPAPRGMAIGPLERRLVLIVLAALLPLVLVAAYILHDTANRQREDLIEATQSRLAALMGAVDAELTGVIASLDTLAASPRQSEAIALHEEAQRLVNRRSGWNNIVLLDRRGQQVMNTRLPATMAPRPASEPDLLAQVLETGRVHVGDLRYIDEIRHHVFAVYLPIREDGEVRNVLAAVLRPEAFHALLASQVIPPPGVAALLDRNGRVVSRTVAPLDSAGREASPSLRALLADGQATGSGITLTLEGAQVYTAFARSPTTGWVLALGLPVEVVDAPVRRAYAVLGGAIILSVLLGLAVSFLVGRTITRPMRDLEDAALRIGRGEQPVLPATRLPEIQRVGTALLDAQREREALLAREREATRQAQQARQQAETANRMKDEFLAMLAHELRNPLAAISSASALLDMVAGQRLGEGSEQGPGAHARAVIRRQVGHMAHLTDDLLNVGRVMTGKIDLKRVPIELATTVSAAVRTLRSTGQLDGHRVDVDVEPVWVNADAARLEQVITNLISNAVKYTPVGGAVRIRLRAEDDHAVLRVADSGVGIEPELLPHVFDLFVQGKRSLDRSQGGLGIGLTLVRRLTELHGGTAQAHSDGPGRGAEFVVRLPSIDAPAPAAIELASTSGENRLRVLLIEDNEDLRATLRSLLSLRGHQVFEAADGRRGVDLVFAEKPDVALVDIGLPVLDGYGVARAVRARLDGTVRLIAMTGYGSASDVDAGLAAGFDGYLIKPVDLQQLERVLRKN